MICQNEAMRGKSILTAYRDPPFNNIQGYWHIHDWNDVVEYEVRRTWDKDDEVSDQLPFQTPFSYLSRKGE